MPVGLALSKFSPLNPLFTIVEGDKAVNTCKLWRDWNSLSPTNVFVLCVHQGSMYLSKNLNLRTSYFSGFNFH